MEHAEAVWKEILLGKERSPGAFRQHLLPLLPLGRIEAASTVGDLSPNINRYLMRHIDMTVVRREPTVFVYSKLGPFVLIGFVYEEHLDWWHGTAVHATEGWIEPRNYSLPRQFARFFEFQGTTRARTQRYYIASSKGEDREGISE